MFPYTVFLTIFDEARGDIFNVILLFCSAPVRLAFRPLFTTLGTFNAIFL